MQNKQVIHEGNLALEFQPTVDDFLDYLGELLAQEYIERMEIASNSAKSNNISED